MAFVPQRPHLFARSIGDNIRLGRPDATDDDVQAAVADAGLEALVERLPAGLETLLGHEGAGLSTGERQRVALARAFVRDAPLLLLDEPTANLDGQTEESVLCAVRRLTAGRTVVIAAHRPSLVGDGRSGRPSDASGGSDMTADGSSERAAGQTAPLGRTLATTRPAFWRLLLATLLGAGAIAADIGLLGTAAWLISRASEHPNESHLAVAIVAVQFFGLTRGLLRYEERLVGHDAAFRLLADVRVKVYERLEALAPGGLPAFRRGDLLARMVQDVDSLQDLVIRVIPPFGMAVLVGALTVALMWWMLPSAGVILAVALLTAGTVVPWLTGFLARRREARFAGLRGDLSASVLDLTEGAAELIAFGANGAQVALVQAQDAELTAIVSASAGTEGIGLAMTTLLAGLACWGCLVVGIPAVASGRLGGTELAVITLIPLAAFELVVGLPVATQALERVRQAAGRVFEVTDAPIPVPEPESSGCRPRRPLRSAGPLGVGRLPRAPSPALRGIDLSLPPGRRVAIIGPSGAGKSTLAAVLLRFLPVESGSVSLNGVSLDRLTGDAVRTVIGLVGQDAYLFDATIAENLRIGNRNATDDELLEVLDRVGLADWLDDAPPGPGHRGGPSWWTPLRRPAPADRAGPGPAGRLSGAGARRTSRASRTGRPPMPSRLDLLDVTERRSLVLITHRLAGLESVDEILVMDAGRVVERGSHDTLLDQVERYARLWWEEMSNSRHGAVGHGSRGTCAGPSARPTASRTPAMATIDRSPHDEHRSRPLAVRHDQHLPLPVRAGHHRAGLPGGAAPDQLVPQRQSGVQAAHQVLRDAAADQRGRRGGDRARPGVRVRDELVELLPVRRATSSGARWPWRAWPPSSSSPPSSGIWIFGWDRLSKKLHLACIWLVAAAIDALGALHHRRQLVDAAPGRLRDERPAPARSSTTSGPCSPTRSSSGPTPTWSWPRWSPGPSSCWPSPPGTSGGRARSRPSDGRRSSRWPCSPRRSS